MKSAIVFPPEEWEVIKRVIGLMTAAGLWPAPGAPFDPEAT